MNQRWPDVKLGTGVNNKEDTKGEPRATYIVELKKVNQKIKAIDLQKIKTTEERV